MTINSCLVVGETVYFTRLYFYLDNRDISDKKQIPDVIIVGNFGAWTFFEMTPSQSMSMITVTPIRALNFHNIVTRAMFDNIKLHFIYILQSL